MAENLFIKGTPKAYITLGIGLVFLLGLATVDPNDPEIFNLMMPKNGIQNFLGMPGALLGGSLYQLFGWSALQIPFFLLFTKFNKPLPLHNRIVRITFSFLAVNVLIALIIPGQDGASVNWAGLFGNVADQVITSWYFYAITIILLIALLMKTFSQLTINSFFFSLVAFIMITLTTFIFQLSKVINVFLGQLIDKIEKIAVRKISPYFNHFVKKIGEAVDFSAIGGKIVKPVEQFKVGIDNFRSTSKAKMKVQEEADRGFDATMGQVEAGLALQNNQLFYLLLKAYESKHFPKDSS